MPAEWIINPKYPWVTSALFCPLRFRKKYFKKYLFFPDSIAKVQTYAATDLRIRVFFSPEDQEQLWVGTNLCLVYSSVPSAQQVAAQEIIVE